jgi:hypothetical protein
MNRHGHRSIWYGNCDASARVHGIFILSQEKGSCLAQDRKAILLDLRAVDDACSCIHLFSNAHEKWIAVINSRAVADFACLALSCLGPFRKKLASSDRLPVRTMSFQAPTAGDGQ